MAGEGEGQVPAEEPADGGGELHPEPVGRVGGIHHQRRLCHRQQYGGAGGEALRHREEKLAILRLGPGRKGLGDPVQLH